MARALRPLFGSLLLGACLAMASTSPASAASISAYVGCSPFSSAPPSHVCQIGDEPGAFFEADAEVEYEVCVSFPGAQVICTEEEVAEAETLYVNVITTEIPGNHLVTWYVEGIEAATWEFRMDEPPSPVPTPTPAPVPTPAAPTVKPPAAVPTVIGCTSHRTSAFAFTAHPRRCLEFRDKKRLHAGELLMVELHWSDWGKNRATAHGRWKHCGMGRCFSGPLDIVASKRRRACGRFAYTHLDVRTVGVSGRRFAYPLELPAC